MKLLSTIFAVAGLTMLSSAAHAAEGGLKVGILTCSLTGSTSAIIYSSEEFTCTFNPNSGSNEMYTGVIKRLGIDLTWERGQQLVWTVIAPATNVGPGALAGDYVGASADVAVAGGVGARVLIGGFEDSIALQPVSLAGNTGAGASAGIESLELTRM